MKERPTLLDLCDKIKLPNEAIEELENIKMTDSELVKWKKLCLTNKEAFYEKVKKCDRSRLLFMYIYLQCACDRYTQEWPEGFTEQIHDDTFYDITRWCKICYREYGEYGIGEHDWIYNHIHKDLYCIGRLQYEKRYLWEDIFMEGTILKEGCKVLNVHIPEGEPLTEAACKASILKAKELFPEYQALVCNTWLLSPGLKNILPETSNIIKFQKLFQMYATQEESSEAIKNIFGKNVGELETLPEDTSLQKNAKAYLLQGKSLGNGKGIIHNYP